MYHYHHYHHLAIYPYAMWPSYPQAGIADVTAINYPMSLTGCVWTLVASGAWSPAAMYLLHTVDFGLRTNGQSRGARHGNGN
eukprot:SAG31_NODE_22755_length_518_cov_1.243437_2_plen_82_part_00